MGAEIDAIKERLSIAAVVGEYVPLKPAGQNLKGICPFHSEKTPSFFVSPKRGTWYCFGACNEGGDIFSFIQKVEGIDFPGALKLLAEKAGVQLSTSRQSQQSSNRRQRLFDALSSAAAFYQQILLHQQAGTKAKQYLLDRGVTKETMTAFQIGYAPHTWDLLQKALKRKGFTDQEMIETGLIGRTNQGKLFDRFRGRIMFPIHDSRGRIIAFGGRIVPWHQTGEEGKYINSPETALYEKRLTVYNLHRAKQALRQGTPCVVVEGYMDVVMMVQSGVHNVVATSGTAFTEGHVQQLSRYTDTLHFAFDADAAGFKATVAATQAALRAGMKVATVSFPAGQDPADVAKDSPANMQTILQQVAPLTAVLLQQLKTTDGKRQDQLEALIPLISSVANPIQQGAMIEEIAATLHVPVDRVIDLVSKAPAVIPVVVSEPLSANLPSVTVVTPERQLLGILINEPAVRQALFSDLNPDFFLDADCLALYTSMQRLASTHSTFSTLPPDALIDALSEREQVLAEGLRGLAVAAGATANQPPLHEGQVLVRTLRRRSLQTSLHHLQVEVEQSRDQGKIAALERFRAISQELANIDKVAL